MVKQYAEIPMPTRPSDPTPLEMAIYNYELKARDFHNTKNAQVSLNETAEDRAKRLLQRDQDWNHLRLERRKIAIQARQQEELEKYRTENREKSIKELSQEAHHPTQKLAKNLLAVGEPKPTTMHEPHHIIPGKGRHLKMLMVQCRLNLHAYGIGINDPTNGIWLRNFAKNKPDDWATPDSPSHRPLHTQKYEQWIADFFSNDNLPESVFTKRLSKVKRDLRNGTHPSNILNTYN